MIACSLLFTHHLLPNGRRPVWRRKGLAQGMRILLLLAIFSVASSAPAIFAENGSITEYHIKAAFLYNFTKFVEWPASAFEDDASPFTLCVMGVEPYISVRESLVGKTIKGRRVLVKRVDGVAAADDCQMFFVSAEESAVAGEDFSKLASHALTVGEKSDFISRGGVINLKTVNNKVRFEIDRKGGERFGFRFSAQLLKLATLVDRGR